MASSIKTLKDSAGNQIIPRTTSAAITMAGNALNLDEKIQALDGEVAALDTAKADKAEVDAKDSLKADKADTYTKTEVDAKDALKADKSTTYTKTDTDTALAQKADKADTYTKAEVDDKDALKADASDTYTKTETDTALAKKADKADTYTKTEVDNKDRLKADQADTYTKAEVDGKDALKADLSEIESARGTEATLGARLDSTDAQLNETTQDFNAQLAETGQRIDNIVTTPVPVGEAIAQEIVDARQGAGSVGANIAEVKTSLAQTTSQAKFSAVSQANARSPLFVQTYDNKNQAVHPSVVKFSEKWNGYYYWMAYTPYANANSDVENPCIAASNDGIVWFTPAGLTNPIDTISPATGYYSDTELIFNPTLNRLECWYRGRISGEYIYRKTSSDGVLWDNKEELRSSVSSNEILSPAVILDEGVYRIWVVDASNNVIKYYESLTGGNWQHIRDITINPDNRLVWHIDVIKSDIGYEMLIAARTVESYDDEIIYYTKSADNITYDAPVLLIDKGGKSAWDEKTLYRATFLKESGIYTIYYSGASVNNEWYLGLTKSIEPDNIFSLKGMDTSARREMVTNRIILDEYASSSATENSVTGYLRYNRLQLKRGTGLATFEVQKDDPNRMHVRGGRTANVYGHIVAGSVQFGAFYNAGTILDGSIRYSGGRHEIYEGGAWVRVGKHLTGATRPATAIVGDMYFDTTLGKPIWLKEIGVWVDATGATV